MIRLLYKAKSILNITSLILRPHSRLYMKHCMNHSLSYNPPKTLKSLVLAYSENSDMSSSSSSES